MAKTRTFTLYLLKEGLENFVDALSESAKAKIKNGEVHEAGPGAFGDTAQAFIFSGDPRPPDWFSDVKSAFPGVPSVTNASSAAVIVFQAGGRFFATSFGHGWQYLDDDRLVSDFGLRVAINALDETKVRRIDRNSLSEAIKGSSHSAFQRDFKSFDLEEALDLVRRISGSSENANFAKNLSGATSLKVTHEMDFADLPVLAEEALEISISRSYESTAFHIVDKVISISDPSEIDALDSAAVASIISGSDDFELSTPSIEVADVVSFGIAGIRLRAQLPDLILKHYRDALGSNLSNLSVENIRNDHKILAVSAADPRFKNRWSVKKSLVGSISHNGGLFAINEGSWYRLDTSFKQDVDAAFLETIDTWTRPPEVVVKKGHGKQWALESEYDYNMRCASAYGQICLDSDNIGAATKPYGKFEACDLLDIDGKRLIHVKKSSRQSSVLSHFFKQGSNSATLLRTFPEAREELVEKVKSLEGAVTAARFDASIGSNFENWTIEYHVIDTPRSDGSFSIPFFSRITLREERRKLQGMLFKVAIRHIRVEP